MGQYLVTVFKNAPATIISGIQSYLRRWYLRRKFYREIVTLSGKGFLTDEDRTRIRHRCQELGLSEGNLKGARKRAYQAALKAASSSGGIDGDQEYELNSIQSFMMIPEREISVEKAALERLRILHEIRIGNPPILGNVNIVLQRNEKAHWAQAGAILEERVVGRRYEGGSQGVTFRVARGVSFRVGNHRGRVVTDKALMEVSSGHLIITNRRLVFSGNAKSFDFRLDKMLSVQFAEDGMIFTSGNRAKPIIIRFSRDRDMEIIRAVLNFVVEKYAA